MIEPIQGDAIRGRFSTAAALLSVFIGHYEAHAQGAAPGVEPGANQGDAGGAIGGVVGGIDGAKNGLIDIDKGASFREYALRVHPKSLRYDDPVRVGAVLPESDVDYYDVPPEYGKTPYRYTVIGGDPVLVDPSTRVIKQVIK